MGGAVSLQQRCRKALVIRAYNSRGPDQTLEDQFSAFSYLKSDGFAYTNADLIKQCLNIRSNEYPWLDPLMQVLSNSREPSSSQPESPVPKKPFEMRLDTFITFLETGTLNLSPSTPSDNAQTPMSRPNQAETPPRKLPHRDTPTTQSPSSSHSSMHSASHEPKSSKPGQFPPVPPIPKDLGGRQKSAKNISVLEINLADVTRQQQLQEQEQSSGKSASTTARQQQQSQTTGEDGVQIVEEVPEEDEPNPLQVIPHPSTHSFTSSSTRGVSSATGKQLWRKREVVRQERTVHYTTIDESGAQQELVEQEVTQTEVLHMECRDTGEFAHKEMTLYENVETFNDEVVNVVTGHEEYVHLKSLEDEFHYMDSNMPAKAGEGKTGERGDGPRGSESGRDEDGGEREHAGEEGAEGGEYKHVYPDEHGDLPTDLFSPDPTDADHMHAAEHMQGSYVQVEEEEGGEGEEELHIDVSAQSVEGRRPPSFYNNSSAENGAQAEQKTDGRDRDRPDQKQEQEGGAPDLRRTVSMHDID